MGFTFNGVHSSAMGIAYEGRKEPLIPEFQRVEEEVFAVDGAYDFTCANPLGRPIYKNKEIVVSCALMGKTADEMRAAARKIAIWLSCGEARLTFDDEPMFYHLAQIANKIDFEQVASRVGRFNLVFLCRPYAYCYSKSGVIPEYGEGLCFGDNTCYGGVNRYTYDAITGKSTPVYNPSEWSFTEEIIGKPFAVSNPGAPVAPIFVFSGLFMTVYIYYKDKFIKVSNASSTELIIDCGRKKVTAKSNDVSHLFSGSFFEIASGDSLLQFDGTLTKVNIDVTFNYRYL